jgi:hypothetical protein
MFIINNISTEMEKCTTNTLKKSMEDKNLLISQPFLPFTFDVKVAEW